MALTNVTGGSGQRANTGVGTVALFVTPVTPNTINIIDIIETTTAGGSIVDKHTLRAGPNVSIFTRDFPATSTISWTFVSFQVT